MSESRGSGDLILAPNEYAFISDTNNGQVNVIVGPKKETLTNTDQPMRYDQEYNRFIRCELRESIQYMPYSDEQSYMVLENPVKDDKDNPHPLLGSNNKPVDLDLGSKINIDGPDTFALYPGQRITVIKGHRLRSNQYLVVRVINGAVAKKNFKSATIEKTDGSGGLSEKDFNMTTGALNIIKGTDVSFYIPPTGVEVLSNNVYEFTRDAVTLERLQYCILIDENGDKRYTKGPSVVFPKPTETFVEDSNGNKVYQAIELNENMGIYVKVIADYEDEVTNDGDVVEHKAGEEIFITGNDMKIYFPRAEHTIIKYGEQAIHFAVAIPKGNAIYSLKKESGVINTIEGPKMFLPNPIEEVIVKKILDDKEVELLFPNNNEAKVFNSTLRNKNSGTFGYVESESIGRGMRGAESLYSKSMNFMDGEEGGLESRLRSVGSSEISDTIDRGDSYTAPRSISIDTKYGGAVNVNVWPGFAIQVVSKTGERKLHVGPSSVTLNYDETLESLALSTGTPKVDHNLLKTAYLRVKNNKVSDSVVTVTKDLVTVKLNLSYKVNFEGDTKNWFNVGNYTKLLSDHLRSIIRNLIKKHGIEEVNANVIDLVRDCILGESKDGKRKGRLFEENGMKVYDVEVLDITIGNSNIAAMIRDAEYNAIQKTIEVRSITKDLEKTKTIEDAAQKVLKLKSETTKIEHDINKKIQANEVELHKLRMDSSLAGQESLNKISNEELSRKKATSDLEISVNESRLDQEVTAFKSKFEAISPNLVSAINSLGDKELATALTKHLPEATGTTGFLMGAGGVDGLKTMIAGTPLAKGLEKLLGNDIESPKLVEEGVGTSTNGSVVEVDED